MTEKQKIRSFHDLIVWQKSVQFSVDIYTVTKTFPKEERFGLISQIQRAAVSVPSNIAEGQARNTKGAFANHLNIALGSAAEIETQLAIALKIGYLENSDYNNLISDLTEITRMLYGLLRTLR
ncbi:MAG: four helix bundle protein [Chloroflexi bacterium]|nr:four helix bundle protein [Chloroflexota bacterium]